MSDWLAARTKYVVLWHAVTSFAVRLRFFSRAHQESKQMSTRNNASRPWTLITSKRLKMYLKEVKLLHSWERHLMLKFPRGLCTYDPTPPTEELGVAAPLWGLGSWCMAFWAPQPDHDMALNFTSDPHFLSWGFLWVFLQHISSQFALLKRQRSRVPKSVFLHVLAAFFTPNLSA